MIENFIGYKKNVSRQTMLYLEKGKYNPSLLLVYKVAKALKSSINEVFIIENNT